ncbi:phospholipase D family protein [Kineococcus sp. SYSU DK001]|uniref:phospholipase D family protein n=1 Tax=Kineococcus sp. SYSU DK001 TaxID=3383122 RepID=UPI003D7F1493
MSGPERGNPATRLPAFREGNAVRPLVDGARFFDALAGAVEAAGRGDVVLFAQWMSDPGQRLREDGPTLARVLTAAARRGVVVKGLVWRTPRDVHRFSLQRNRRLARRVRGRHAEVLLDQRVRVLGSHHQKFFVVRYAGRPHEDVAFVGGIDVAHGRRDDPRHRSDPQALPLSRPYGRRAPWHDVHSEIRGPAVHDVETVFRERWEDPAPLSNLPWQRWSDVLDRKVLGVLRRRRELPAQTPPPPVAGTCTVQLLRTYPLRRPPYPFAPRGEFSVAAGHAKALQRARRLVYVEDQFLYSALAARPFARALRADPALRLVLVVPRAPKANSWLTAPAQQIGQVDALRVLRAAGGDRVEVYDVENDRGRPVYVHSTVCVIDDVWACVRSDNLCRRSWTHDSELSAAVLDGELDAREPLDPGGLGEGARRFARDLRLSLVREHLGLADSAVAGELADPVVAADALRRSADALDAWYRSGRRGPRPPGHLRRHRDVRLNLLQRLLARPVHRYLIDPAG